MRVPGIATVYETISKALIKRGVPIFTSGIMDSAERDMLHTGYTLILRPGLILGRNTNNGRWFICYGTTLSADEAAAQTTLSVVKGTGLFPASDPDAAAFNIKIVGPGGIPAEQNLGAVVTVGATSIVVTTALLVDYPSGSFVYRSPATDYGQDIAQGILWSEASVDAEIGGGDVDAQVVILTHGIVDSAQLIGSTDLFLGQLRDPDVGSIAHRFEFE